MASHDSDVTEGRGPKRRGEERRGDIPRWCEEEDERSIILIASPRLQTASTPSCWRSWRFIPGFHCDSLLNYTPLFLRRGLLRVAIYIYAQAEIRAGAIFWISKWIVRSAFVISWSISYFIRWIVTVYDSFYSQCRNLLYKLWLDLEMVPVVDHIQSWND